MQWILFDETDRPIRLTTLVKTSYPSARMMKLYNATIARPTNACTREQYEDAYRNMRSDRRTKEDKRRLDQAQVYRM